MKEPITFEDAGELVVKFRDEREWRRYHTPKNLAESMAIEVAELLQLFQWIGDEEVEEYCRSEEGRRRVAEELADVVIYALSMADVIGVDLGRAVRDKVAKNEDRYPVEEFRGKFVKKT